MNNFARSLPNNTVKKLSVATERREINIEAQHQKWAKHLRKVQGQNRKTRTSLIERIEQYSNVQIAIIGAIFTSMAVAATIAIFISLGF